MEVHPFSVIPVPYCGWPRVCATVKLLEAMPTHAQESTAPRREATGMQQQSGVPRSMMHVGNRLQPCRTLPSSQPVHPAWPSAMLPPRTLSTTILQVLAERHPPGGLRLQGGQALCLHNSAWSICDLMLHCPLH